jgi:hypothetical protein
VQNAPTGRGVTVQITMPLVRASVESEPAPGAHVKLAV